MRIAATKLAVVSVMVVASVLASVVPAQSAGQGARVFHERLRGLTVVAVGSAVVDDCTFKTVVIGAGPTAGQTYEASFEEFVYDECTGDEKEVAGFARPTVFEVSGVGQLRRAHLVADIPLDDGRVVHVDETFIGIGAIYRDARVDVDNDRDFHFLSTQLERYRDARATGTVTAWRAYLLYARQGLFNVCIPRVYDEPCYF